MASRLYNLSTYLWHKILRVPITLRPAYDNKVKHPELTVVFLHGISANSTTWKSTFRELEQQPTRKRVRLVALDLLGFGRSLRADWLRYDECCYSKALDRSLRKLKTHGKLVLVGHSMGSLIAADYVVNYEEHVELRKMILASPPVLMADELAKMPDKVYTKSYSSIHKLANNVPAMETVAKIIQKFTSFRSDYIKTCAFERSMENIILNRKNYQTFVKIRVPTIIIHGHFDPLVMGSNLRRIAAHNPRYIKYVSVIGQHDVSVGKRAKIILEIKKTLEEQAHETI